MVVLFCAQKHSMHSWEGTTEWLNSHYTQLPRDIYFEDDPSGSHSHSIFPRDSLTLNISKRLTLTLNISKIILVYNITNKFKTELMIAWLILAYVLQKLACVLTNIGIWVFGSLI